MSQESERLETQLDCTVAHLELLIEAVEAGDQALLAERVLATRRLLEDLVPAAADR